MRMELLIGPIASGKSTYAATRAAQGAVVVCDDAVALAVHGGDYGGYSTGLKPLYCAVEAAIITHAAMAGRDVVVDTGGRTRSKRARFAALGRSLGYSVGVVCFRWESARVHAARRTAADGRGLGYEEWLRIALAHETEFEAIDPTREHLEVFRP